MKTKRMASFFASFAALLFASPALAHHGFAGRYDEDHPVTVMGTVVEVQFVNPHSFIFFEVTDKNGKTAFDIAAESSRSESTAIVLVEGLSGIPDQVHGSGPFSGDESEISTRKKLQTLWLSSTSEDK